MTKRQKIRESGDEASSTAARLVARLRGCSAHWTVHAGDGLTVGEVRSVCMSVLNQDQTKGKRPAKRKRVAKRGRK